MMFVTLLSMMSVTLLSMVAQKSAHNSVHDLRLTQHFRVANTLEPYNSRASSERPPSHI